MTQEAKTLSSILLALIGFIYATILTMEAFWLTGGGHGWNAAMLSFLSVILVPAFGIALPFRDRGYSQLALLIILAGALMVDL